MDGGDAARRGAVLAATQMWEERTCVRFKEVANESALSMRNAGINIVSGGSCAAHVGTLWPNAINRIYLGWCNHMRYVGSVAHEFGHAMGMMHEQNRPDATTTYYGHGPYLRLYPDNIKAKDPSWLNAFRRIVSSYIGSSTGPNDERGGYQPYDFASVMHYSQYSSAWIGKAFDTIPEGQPTGNRNWPTDHDYYQINDMYNCRRSRTPTPAPTQTPTRQPTRKSWRRCRLSVTFSGLQMSQLTLTRRANIKSAIIAAVAPRANYTADDIVLSFRAGSVVMVVTFERPPWTNSGGVHPNVNPEDAAEFLRERLAANSSDIAALLSAAGPVGRVGSVEEIRENDDSKGRGGSTDQLTVVLIIVLGVIGAGAVACAISYYYCFLKRSATDTTDHYDALAGPPAEHGDGAAVPVVDGKAVVDAS